MAICAERPIRRIKCFSPNADNRAAFARDMAESGWGLKLPRWAASEDALRDADVVACSTSALDPILGHNHIRPGVHYSSIKPAEIGPQAINACSRAVVHLRDNAPLVVRTHGVELAEDKKGALALRCRR